MVTSSLIVGAGEVGKLLGEKWKHLTDKEKKPYEEKAKTDKERYEREKVAYASVSDLFENAFPVFVMLTAVSRELLRRKRRRTTTRSSASPDSLTLAYI